MRRKRIRLRQRILASFGVKRQQTEAEYIMHRLPMIQRYHQEMMERGDRGEVDTITWSDLQMDDLFARINHTKSYIGEQVLYDRLHRTDCNPEERMIQEKQITLFQKEETVRVDIEEKLCAIGKEEGAYQLISFLMHTELWKIGNTFPLHVLQAILCVMFAGLLITESYLFAIGLVSVACVNLMIYLRAKMKYETFLYAFGTLKQILDFGKFVSGPKMREILGISEDMVSLTKRLAPLSKRIFLWNRRKTMTLTGDAVSILKDYLYGITLIDIAMFNHVMRLIDGRQADVIKLYQYIGEMDMNIAIASYRESLPCYCLPEINEREMILAEGMIHPLVEGAVPNDFTLNRRAMITGANAAGKSTFMKALAINVILAKTIHTASCEKLCIPDLSVMTSMALRDNVLQGESYYFREAKRIHQMIEEEEQGKQTLLVIDEMLKGTNTIERIAASTSILYYLAESKNFVMVATHDMELLTKLGNRYEDYFFDSAVKENDIFFDYKIHKGRGGKTNAIELLSLLKYPREIVKRARQELIENYEN